MRRVFMLRSQESSVFFWMLLMPISENIATLQDHITGGGEARVAPAGGDCADGGDQDTYRRSEFAKRTTQDCASSARIAYRSLPEKPRALAGLTGAEWHMIGHLQTNKAAKAAELFSAVDSVDSCEAWPKS